MHDFLNDKSQNGSLTLKSRRLRFRYRVVIHPGLTGEVDATAWFDAEQGLEVDWLIVPPAARQRSERS